MSLIHPRPESQLDEELFTRLVELDGLRRRSRMRENQTYMKRSDPDRCFHISVLFNLNQNIDFNFKSIKTAE